MDDTKNVLNKFKELPAMPSIMVKALGIINNEKSGLKELADVMSYDQALTTQVLRLVNSAYYSFAQQVTSVSKALPLLGMVQAKNIVVACAMKPMLTSSGGKDLWVHSIKVAVACEYIASKLKLMEPSEAFVLGFLHDIGKLVLNTQNSAMYDTVLQMEEDGSDIIEVEQTFFGTDHCDVGFLLAKKWQLPILVNNCIKYHHRPNLSSMSNFVYVVYVADLMMKDYFEPSRLDEDIMKTSNVKAEAVLPYRDIILEKANNLLTQLAV